MPIKVGLMPNLIACTKVCCKRAIYFDRFFSLSKYFLRGQIYFICLSISLMWSKSFVCIQNILLQADKLDIRLEICIK